MILLVLSSFPALPSSFHGGLMYLQCHGAGSGWVHSDRSLACTDGALLRLSLLLGWGLIGQCSGHALRLQD